MAGVVAGSAIGLRKVTGVIGVKLSVKAGGYRVSCHENPALGHSV